MSGGRSYKVTCCDLRYPFSLDQSIPETEWELVIRETANLIIEQQSPQRWVWHWVWSVLLLTLVILFRLLDVRTNLYDLIKHCIPPEIIFKVCVCVCAVGSHNQFSVKVTRV